MESCENIRVLHNISHEDNQLHYYLIDRDYLPPHNVEKYWNDVRNGEGKLLCWRKRHIESYLINPELIKRFSGCIPDASIDDIQQKLVELAQNNLYKEVCCYLINEINHKIRGSMFPFPGNPINCKQDVVDFIVKIENTSSRCSNIIGLISEEKVNSEIDRISQILKGDVETLTYGEGLWIDFFNAKPLLTGLIENFFRDKDGNKVKAAKAIKEYSRELGSLFCDISTPTELIPSDFRELKAIFDNIH